MAPCPGRLRAAQPAANASRLARRKQIRTRACRAVALPRFTELAEAGHGRRRADSQPDVVSRRFGLPAARSRATSRRQHEERSRQDQAKSGSALPAAGRGSMHRACQTCADTNPPFEAQPGTLRGRSGKLMSKGSVPWTGRAAGAGMRAAQGFSPNSEGFPLRHPCGSTRPGARGEETA